MPSILLAVDGSDNALRAVKDFVAKRDWYQQPVELHEQLIGVELGNEVLHLQQRLLHGRLT